MKTMIFVLLVEFSNSQDLSDLIKVFEKNLN
jgi:hypothetical protein